MVECVTDNAKLAAVWLLSTLTNFGSGNTGYRKKYNKSNHNIDIVSTCTCIIEVSNRLSLQKTSNLLFGTVLAYKRKCLQDWNDVNNCRLLIKRLDIVNTYKNHNNHNNNNKTKKYEVGFGSEISNGTGIMLRKDDPGFDIMHGLVNMKECELQQNKWNTYGFEEIDDMLELEIDENELITQGKNDNEGVWDHDVNFRFNTSGDVIDENGNIDKMEVTNQNENENKNENENRSEQEIINENFLKNLEMSREMNAMELDPFDLNNDHFDKKEMREGGQEIAIETRRKRKNKAKTNKYRHRLVLDKNVLLNISSIREIRDGYVEHEKEKRAKVMQGKMNENIDVLLSKFTDYKQYQDGYSKLKFQNQSQDIPEFELDIEMGRMRGHSRSSSVSSIEEARRATYENERHSSSFQFDFNNPIQRSYINEDINDIDDINIAQLDISVNEREFRPGELNNQEEREKEDDEKTEISLISVEDFYQKLISLDDKEKEILFSDVMPRYGISRKEVTTSFMQILQLATWNRIRVCQRDDEIQVRVFR